jgi:hypothetical protein
MAEQKTKPLCDFCFLPGYHSTAADCRHALDTDAEKTMRQAARAAAKNEVTPHK